MRSEFDVSWDLFCTFFVGYRLSISLGSFTPFLLHDDTATYMAIPALISYNDLLLSYTLSNLRHPIISASVLFHPVFTCHPHLHPLPHLSILSLLCSQVYVIASQKKRKEHPLTTFHTCLDCFYAISQPSDRLICSNDMPAFSYRARGGADNFATTITWILETRYEEKESRRIKSDVD